jgi:hypothetical protein
VGVTGLASTVAAKVSDVADAATNVFFNVKASALVGTTDSMSVTVDGFAGTNVNVGSAAAAGVAGGGIETLSLVASGETSTIASLGSGATTINVDADAQLTVSAFSSTGITALNAGESSATVSFNVGGNIGANVFAYTGSAGADTLISTTGFAGTDSIAGGEGADTFSIRPAGGAADRAAVGALNASSATVFSGIETLDMRSAAGNAVDFTVDMDTMPGITAINLRTAATDAEAIFTLNDLTATQAGAITVLHTGTDADTDSEIIVDMKTDTAADTVTVTATTSLAGQIVQVNDANSNVENLALTVNGDMNQNVDLSVGSFLTSIDIDGGGAARTMAIFANSTTTTGFAGASIDLSGVLSNTTLELEGGAEQTFKGGSGRDTLTVLGTLSAGDVLDGGAGATDTLSMNNASVTTVNALSATLASTLSGNITGFERITISDALNQGLNMADFGTSSNRLILANDFTGPETVSNLNNGSTIVTSSQPNATGDILTLSTVGAAAGTADTITIITDGNTAIDYGQFALSGYETITINATQSTADAANLRIATMGLNVTQAGGAQSTVNFTGTESVTLSEALDAQIVSSTALTGALIMGASSTAGSQTITGGSGADTLVGSSSGDTITGGAGIDIITGNAGNDVIDGGAGADEIDASAGINIVTGGGGSDDIHLTTATTGIAVQLTTVTDFNAGTSTTGVDQVEFTLSELNAANGDLAGAVGFMTTGLGADNGGANASRLASTGNTLTTQRVTGDGQTGLAATELFLIDNGATYENDNAFETALAAGQVTFSTGTVDDNDAILIAYTSTAGHVNVGIGQFAGTTGSSDTIDGFQTLVTLESVSMANLDSSDFLITG